MTKIPGPESRTLYAIEYTDEKRKRCYTAWHEDKADCLDDMHAAEGEWVGLLVRQGGDMWRETMVGKESIG